MPNRLERAISYDSFRPKEYYNDFLKPQQIHHKLIVNLVAEKELYGRIVLTRPRKYSRFTREEIQTAKAISPYLAHALAHNDLRRKIQLKGNIINHIEKESSVGMILLNEDLQIIYRNPKAEEVFARLNISGDSENPQDPVYGRLLKDCRERSRWVWTKGLQGESWFRSIALSKARTTPVFRCISKVIDQASDRAGSRLLMVSIEEKSQATISPQYLMDDFHLSRRGSGCWSLCFLWD